MQKSERTIAAGSDAELAVLDLAMDIADEVIRARSLWPPMHSLHEAYAVILEEFDEVKAETFKRQNQRDAAAVRKELIHTAAMCMRAILDLGPTFEK
jgi:hypothetical protein